MALSHAPQIVSDGLIIYLDANNTSSYAGTGSTWYDLSGNSRHASLISSPSYEGFGKGKYLSFDGSTNYATIPYTITDNLITVSFWYYSKIFSANSFLDALISNYTNGISGFDVRLNSSTTINLAIVIAASESQISIGAITNNTWYHVAFTYDGATVKTYLDAVFKSSTNVIGTRANGTQICIGTSAYDTNRRATCGIPQVMIYNRALSDTEILQNYNATKGRYIVNENIVRGNLVVNLDAGNPSSYSGTGNTAYDVSAGIAASLLNGVGYSNTNGGSFSFDGSNDYIQISSSYTQIFTAGTTIDVWVKFNASGSYERILDISDGAGTNTVYIVAARYSTTNDIIIASRSSTGQNLTSGIRTTTTPITNGTIQNFTFVIGAGATDTIPASGAKIYCNSILQSTTLDGDTYNYVPNVVNKYAWIGRSNFAGNAYLSANIYTFRIYNRELSAQEIKQNYNALKNRYGLT
jgi:hypothetical protein